MEALKYCLSWLTWPGLLLICIGLTAYGFSVDMPILYFNISYALLIAALFWLEKFMPFERAWQNPDGQIFPDLAHTFSSKGTVQLILLFSSVIGLSEFMKPVAEHQVYGIWPRGWPLFIQVVMGMVIAEFPLYWAHRFGHRRPLWRFHMVHHSVTKLWIVNTGRFHFMDSLIKIVMSLAVLIAFGAPQEVIQWLTAITAFIGLLTHCNVEMRFGPLSWWFNTPELHRWHHSRDVREGNKNYGENIMAWDHIFGSFFNEKRRPPANIGIKEFMPPHFTHQIIWPFLTREQKIAIRIRHYNY
ncbi:MAG: sterol desaturase family protein [Alphaproteobacteria bacterium]